MFKWDNSKDYDSNVFDYIVYSDPEKLVQNFYDELSLRIEFESTDPSRHMPMVISTNTIIETLLQEFHNVFTEEELIKIVKFLFNLDYEDKYFIIRTLNRQFLHDELTIDDYMLCRIIEKVTSDKNIFTSDIVNLMYRSKRFIIPYLTAFKHRLSETDKRILYTEFTEDFSGMFDKKTTYWIMDNIEGITEMVIDSDKELIYIPKIIRDIFIF